MVKDNFLVSTVLVCASHTSRFNKVLNEALLVLQEEEGAIIKDVKYNVISRSYGAEYSAIILFERKTTPQMSSGSGDQDSSY